MSAGPIVIFGSNGQLGARLVTALERAGHEVVALDRAACDFATADQKKIDVTLRALEPALIINAAAYTAVDKAESERDLAHHINATVPGWIATAAAQHGAPMLHFSTDYVFDGIRGRYTEDTQTAPLNSYGESKLAGEKAVRAADGYVFRLQWVYDTRGNNFLRTIARLIAEKDELNIVADQLGAPTPAKDIAAAITELTPHILAGGVPPAIYHLAAGGYTSWHGFACAIAGHLPGKARLIPITTAEYPTPATRPLDGRLNCTAIAAHGITLPHWRHALAALLSENAVE